MTRMRRSSRPGSLIWLSSSPKPRLLKSENMASMPQRRPSSKAVWTEGVCDRAMIQGSGWPASCTMATLVRTRCSVSSMSRNRCSPQMLAAREALHQRGLAAGLEHEQVLLEPQPPAPVLLPAPRDQRGRAVKPIPHQRGTHPRGQKTSDRLERLALLGEADRALGLLHAPG